MFVIGRLSTTAAEIGPSITTLTLRIECLDLNSNAVGLVLLRARQQNGANNSNTTESD